MISELGQGTNIMLYADYTNIWREITCELDQIILQNDIDSLYKWSKSNKMNFNLDKCKVVAITNKTVEFPLPFYDHTYTINGQCLDYEYSEDLGVFIT